MEVETSGRVTTEAIFENLEDLWAVKRGLLHEASARRLVIAEALVDTGATLLSLPTKLIGELGLSRVLIEAGDEQRRRGRDRGL